MGKKRKVPDTSLAAYHRADEIIEPHHKEIIGALRILRKAISEEIAHKIKGFDKNQVSRRMLELVKAGFVNCLDEKRKTSSNRDAHVYELTEKGLIVDISKMTMPTPEVVNNIKRKKSEFASNTSNLF